MPPTVSRWTGIKLSEIVAQCVAVKVLKVIFLIILLCVIISLASVKEDGCLECLRELHCCGDEIHRVCPFSAGVVPDQGGHGEENEKKAVYHVLQ